MTPFLRVILTSAFVLGHAVAGENQDHATIDGLLATNQTTIVKHPSTNAPDMATANWEFFNDDYRLAFTSEPILWGKDRNRVTVRVWDKAMKSWPGSQPQVIQVVNENDFVLSATKVGGEPKMTQAWTARYLGRLFIYIQCNHRRGPPPGTYIYEVAQDYSIEEQGVFFDKKDVEVRENRMKERIERHRRDQETPNKASQAIGAEAAPQPER